MKKNIIQEILFSNIKDQKAFFVFPSQIAADMWAEYLITNSSVKAVAMERFIAWDKFKGESIRGQHQDKTSIPSAMRKIFISNLIDQNAKNPFFKNLIIPEYAKNAAGFTNWLTKLLPPLKNWKKAFEASGTPADSEDSDLLKLYDCYKEFLNNYNFFDPAWENPPFIADGNKYFIIFPELLSDYSEYEPILSNSPENIIMVHVPNETLSQENAKAYFFDNSRKEIRCLSLYLRKIHEEKNIPWNKIAVSVPDIENFGPYLERDFKIYEIPFVSHNATSLTSTGAGNLFPQLLNCAQQNYSFESIKELLLNTDLPWKDQKAIFHLINFGKENNCVCSFEYNEEKIDVWKKSFSSPKKEYDEQANQLYNDLNKYISNLVASKSFKEIRTNYFIFRDKFFDLSICSEKTDKILSRCISELGELINFEEKYKSKVTSPFSFYSSYLAEIKYLEQKIHSGVQILPYRLSFCAPFDLQVVVDSSQTGLSVIYKDLSFLREDKRKVLMKGKEDPNVSELFIKLYEMNSISEEAFFTCSSKTFTGYAQVSSYLTEINSETEENLQKLLNDDPYKNEKNYFLELTSSFPKEITNTAMNGLSKWKENQDKDGKEILNTWSYEYDEKIPVSATSLKNFFKCPRKWALDVNKRLEEQHNYANLIEHVTLGNLYHKIFEYFCKELKEKNLLLICENDKLPEEYENILLENIDKAIESEKNSYLTKELLLTTKTDIINTAYKAIKDFSKIFNGCSIYNSEEKYTFTDEKRKISFEGRIDCLLVDPSSSEMFLVDFKSFEKAIPKNIFYDPETETLPDFQLPMYLYLLKNQAKSITVENCCFYNVTKSEIELVFGKELHDRYKTAFPTTRPANRSPDEFIESEEKFQEAVDIFIQKIKDKDFSVSEKAQNFEICSKCDYRALCRRTFNVSKQD